MVAQVISFFQRTPRQAASPIDWTQQELAEFYRVESALIRAGIRVGTDRGLSDENEPWFCFYRSDDGEVVIHFARIDGEYLIAGPAYEEIARGVDFTALVRNMVSTHPLIRRNERGSNISVHPAALLIAVVGTAFFKTGEARAAESGAGNGGSSHSRPTLLQSSSNNALAAAPGFAPQAAPYDTAQLPANQAVLILAAALFASEYRAETSALTQQSQAAIAAAAAALDFDAAPAPTISEQGSAVIDSGHVMVADNSPGQTISSVLTLTAILSTLPTVVDATPGVLADPISSDVASVRSRASAAHDPQPQMAPQWALEVRFAWANAPDVQAVQLVRDAIDDNGPQTISVIQVEKLPDILADIIARGSHHTVNPTPPPTGEIDTPPAPPQTGGSTGDTGTGNPAPVDETPATPGQDPDTSIGNPSTPETPVTPTKPTLPPFMGFASQELVQRFIDYFVAHTNSVEIMTSGQQVVIYDTRVLHNPGAIEHLTSMTFNFFDGSSVNLVGDHSSFLHGGVLV